MYRGKSKTLCVPGLNCYSCPGATAACPLGSFQTALTKSAFKLPLYTAGMLLLFGIMFGRMICGFLCPFGLLQELVYKIPSPKIKKNGITAKLSLLKYAVLFIFVIAVPLIMLTPGFCKFICPAGTLEAGIPFAVMDPDLRSRLKLLFSWKIFVLIICLLLCVILYRAFCRFLCPLGALYSFFNPVSFFGIKVDKSKCGNCMHCIKACPMDIGRPGDRECISCGKCRKNCPGNAVYYSNTDNRIL